MGLEGANLHYSLEHNTTKKITKGKNSPLGATVEKDGVNFAIFSQYAKEVYLLLFNKSKRLPTDVIKLSHRTGHIWHAFVHGIKPKQLYGYKIRGDYLPKNGFRFNEYKMLIDPYAKALTGKFKNKDNLLLAYDINSPKKDLIIDSRDNTALVPKCIVIDDQFDWQDDEPPHIPIEKLVIYEVHLKGFTKHKSARVKHHGSYVGFIKKIPYLQELGVNAVEFLPIHDFYIRDDLIQKGLSNYWGYNTIAFFAPESSYCTQSSRGCQVKEFKTLLRELHKAGIEVILDVAYNHSGEGNELGPTLCFKGIDNPTYYALKGPPEEPYRYYKDFTGTGNTLNIENPQFLRLVMDSLRYWVEVMHVDGFRFDLASVLARVKGEYDRNAPFFEVISNDPVLSKVKLIAEPWDIITYQVGNFPINWSEWNGTYRDTVRKFLIGQAGQVGDLGWRLTGSADLYGDDNRSPYNSINFITCHDGFTLNDLFSYNSKHNEANLEDNKDGTDENNSWNCGVEGETDDIKVINLRKKMIKNAFCLLLFSIGTPMILGGDEFMRTQRGNNNAYCQDNDISWFNWNFLNNNKAIFGFCKKAIAFRKKYTVLQRNKFVLGKDLDADNVPDISWFGDHLQSPDWKNPELRTVCYQLDGSEVASELGNYHLFFILNMDNILHKIQIPSYVRMKWFRIIDTSLDNGDDFLEPDDAFLLDPQDSYQVNPKSTVVLISR